MTLMKSLLLGSAAALVVVASAEAADLPTKKGAPAAEYVRICSISANGKTVVGFVLPGSDTCFKISGYLTAQIQGGNLSTGYSTSYAPGSAVQTATGTTGRDSLGYTNRLRFAFDAVSNTNAGPLAAHAELNFNNGNGYDSGGTSSYINKAYVTWAGITAGKANSFFSFTGSGPGWVDFFSPDQQDYNQPDLIAYTASFGNGFSASIAAQDPQSPANNAGGAAGTNMNALTTNGFTDYTYGGMRWPDFVANLKISQGWGKAQLSGVVHDVDVTAFDGATHNVAGWAIDAGISFNLPQLGSGDDILLTGAYSQNATWFSGIPNAMWNEWGQVNGNGQQMALADTYYNGSQWQTPTAWTVQTEFDHTFSAEVSGSLVAGFGGLNWSSGTSASVVSNATTWLVGGVLNYEPVKNLVFTGELFYQSSNSSTPNSYSTAKAVWNGDASGAEARFYITRSW